MLENRGSKQSVPQHYMLIKGQKLFNTGTPGPGAIPDNSLTSPQLLFTPRLRAPYNRPRTVCANAAKAVSPRPKAGAGAGSPRCHPPADHSLHPQTQTRRPRRPFPALTSGTATPTTPGPARTGPAPSGRRVGAGSPGGLAPRAPRAPRLPGRVSPVHQGRRGRCQWLPL